MPKMGSHAGNMIKIVVYLLNVTGAHGWKLVVKELSSLVAQMRVDYEQIFINKIDLQLPYIMQI